MAIVGVDLSPDSLVLTRGRDFKWVFENLDDNQQPVNFPAGALYFELDTGGQLNAIQQVRLPDATGGTYTLTHIGQTTTGIDYSDINEGFGPGDITDALEALSNIAPGDVIVSPVLRKPVWRCTIQLGGSPQNEIQSIDATNVVADMATWLGIAESAVIGNGKFKLSFAASTTGEIRFDASAADVETALELLPKIGPGNVTVTKPADYHWIVEFTGILANRNVEQIEVAYFKADTTAFLDAATDLLTTVSSSTTQQGHAGAFDERLATVINTEVNNFFNLFDSTIGLDIQFVIDNTVATPTMTLTIFGLRSYDSNTAAMFVLDNALSVLQTWFNNILSLAHVFTIVSPVFYWDRYYTVEFTNNLGLDYQPLLVADPALLTSTANPSPQVEVTNLQVGVPRFTKWTFAIASSTATIKIESEICDDVPKHTEWQLVFLPSGEPVGGDPIAYGRVETRGHDR